MWCNEIFNYRISRSAYFTWVSTDALTIISERDVHRACTTYARTQDKKSAWPYILRQVTHEPTSPSINAAQQRRSFGFIDGLSQLSIGPNTFITVIS